MHWPIIRHQNIKSFVQNMKRIELISFIYALIVKLQPAIFPLSQHVVCFHELPAATTQRFLE